VSQTFHALSIRNYRIYAAGGIVSNVGTWMQRVAQDWLVLQLTGSPAALGITTGLQFLPMLLFSMWGGVLAERYPKRRVLLCTQSFMAATAAVLGLLVITGAVATWHVFVLAFLLGVGTAVDGPARQSFVIELVGREEVPNAVGLNSASFNVARIIGPFVAGLLIVAFGDNTGPVFLINAASFAAVIFALTRLRGEELEPAPVIARGPGQLREGVRYVLARRDLLCVLAIVFFAGTFGLNFQMTTALMATEIYGRGAGAYGLLGSILAVGSLSGALLSARRGAPRLRLIVIAGLVFGALTIAAGLMPTYWLFAASLVPVGFSALTLITSANATMQLGVAATMRGRVMALYMTMFMGGTAVGAPLIGMLAEVFGARWSLIGGGAIVVVGTAGSALVLVRRQGMVMRDALLLRRTQSIPEQIAGDRISDVAQRP
jgi:MFS family permease